MNQRKILWGTVLEINPAESLRRERYDKALIEIANLIKFQAPGFE